MHFTILNGNLMSPNWTWFRYKAVITVGIGLVCVILLGEIVKFLKSFQFILFFFQKTRIKDCFKFSILDLDICLN